MSDSAYQGDESDVLASVRRLVTPEGDRKTLRASAPGSGTSTEKLLLTPALRVNDEDPDPEENRTGEFIADVEPGRTEPGWSLEDRIAELEAAVGAVPDEWEPDGSEQPDQETPREFIFQHRPLSLAGFEVERADPQEQGAQAALSAADEADEVDIVGGEARIDEEALRDLVAEIVRQELQGELGQRVTRNIRKLVRREVHRALLSRDLDPS